MPTPVRSLMGTTELSYNGERYTADASGVFNVPDGAVADLIGSHGFALVGAVPAAVLMHHNDDELVPDDDEAAEAIDTRPTPEQFAATLSVPQMKGFLKEVGATAPRGVTVGQLRKLVVEHAAELMAKQDAERAEAKRLAEEGQGG